MEKDTRHPIDRALDQLFLCKEVVSELHSELELPKDPDAQADLLLAVEALTREVFSLREFVNTGIWGEPKQQPEE